MYTQRRAITHVNYLDTNGSSMKTGFDARRLCQIRANEKTSLLIYATVAMT